MDVRLRVLCVDDNQETADSTALLLRHAGFEARACHSGPEALAVAEAFRPEVCLIDLGMPGMDGDQLATQLRRQAGGQALRCIALTGSWDIAAQHRTHNAGFEAHLVKPVDPERLVAAVRGAGDGAPAASDG
jgi:CheY-like chemotaxis protein